MITLHLDQATHTGWATWEDGELLAYGDWVGRGGPEAIAQFLHSQIRGPFDVITLETNPRKIYRTDAKTGRKTHNEHAAVFGAGLRVLLKFLLESDGRTVEIQDINKVRAKFKLHTNKAFVAAARQFPGVVAAPSEDAATAIFHGAYWWASGSVVPIISRKRSTPSSS